MFSIFDELVKCPRCGFHVETSHLIDSKQGLPHNFQIKCRSLSCQWSKIQVKKQQEMVVEVSHLM